MEPNAFVNKTKKPTPTELSKALGSSKVLWDKLVSDVTTKCQIDVQEWKSCSPKSGWSLRLIHKKRNILYLGPLRGAFRVALILGDKAIDAARKSSLPSRAMKLIDEAKNYPEGTAIRIDVKSEKDVELVRQFAVIKLEN